ncbi:hypothetical protein ACH9DO_03270 [Kocuria sp. M1N1S27]|uniref:phage tail protein n=1 Tax=Kocuria kalidii TaxID=3376283 RepID=UPI0037954FF5
MLQSLQRSAGNAAASAYVQRLAERPGPVTSAAVSPQSDPRFQAVAAQVAGQGRRLRQHPPPRAEARKAADAADAPATDKEAKAKASQADTMNTAKPGGFDKAGFIAAVKKAIAAQAPQNLDQAENFEKSGKAEAVKAEVSGKVTEGKKASAQDIAEKTVAAPDTSKMPEKPVTPLRPEPQPTAPRVNTAAAMPAPVPAAQTDLSGGQRETDTAMAEAGVTEQQLATSNEPEFTDALAAKKEGEEHSTAAPSAFRESETAQLGAAKQEAQGAGVAGLAGMLASKKGTLSGAAAGKTAAKTRDEAERARIATQIKTIFDATKTDVDSILSGLDAKVDQEFSTGEAAVRKAFTADLNARMDAYKDKRYSGAMGKLRWADDLFGDLPKEADECYVEARKLYEQDMGVLISRVADLIGTQLTAAKDRIAKGRADIKAYVQAQPKNLQKLAQQAAGEFASQFDQLESDVDAKKDALVDDLAAKYSESKAAVEEEITAMQEENKGLWSKAKAAVGGAIRTITQLKDLLTSALARAAGAIGKIIKDPIGFLGKFVKAVKGGIVRFGENIAEHLKAGLQGWLLGSLSAAGIQLPAKLDLKGIIGLVLSLLGLTWPAIRARIAKHIPEKVMSGVEKSVAFIQVILSEGVGGLWKWVVEKLGDVKEMVMGQIREFVITKIVKAGITWLISMLNPAAAFIKACKMIYDVVMFFVERAAQIKEFVDSVLDSVESIASGGVDAVAGYIEKTLAKMVPVLLGFLASLLGLGGISEKIKEIIATVQKPVGQVVDKLIAGAVRIGKKLLQAAGTAFDRTKRAIISSVNITKSITMKQTAHKLSTRIERGRIVIEMASRRELLTRKIERALHNKQIQSNADAVGALKEAQEKLKGHPEKWDTAKWTSSKEKQNKALDEIDQEVTEIAYLLQRVGHAFDIDNLRESIWVLGGEIHPKYQGSPIFRKTFYGTFNSYVNTSFRRITHNKLIEDKISHKASLDFDPFFKKGKSFRCPGFNRGPHLAAPDRGRDEWFSLDHNDPSVVGHWNSTGRGTKQSERKEWYNYTENLRGLCMECNREKGGGDNFNYEIREGFEGPHHG